MKIKILMLVAMLSMQGQASAGRSTNEILIDCESNTDFRIAACWGFIEAVSDTHDTFVDWKLMTRKFCISDAVTVPQLVKVFVKYANEHPGDLHHTAASIIANAFGATFPCE